MPFSYKVLLEKHKVCHAGKCMQIGNFTSKYSVTRSLVHPDDHRGIENKFANYSKQRYFAYNVSGHGRIPMILPGKRSFTPSY